jgi:hypothetical protein
MLWSLLADSLVILHLAFTAFVSFGGFLTWRWPRLALAHVPALAWGCWVEVSHSICPLTPLENHFRHLGGEAGYRGGFLAHYLARVLYPPGSPGRCNGRSQAHSSPSMSSRTRGSSAAGDIPRDSSRGASPCGSQRSGRPARIGVKLKSVNGEFTLTSQVPTR